MHLESQASREKKNIAPGGGYTEGGHQAWKSSVLIEACETGAPAPHLGQAPEVAIGLAGLGRLLQARERVHEQLRAHDALGREYVKNGAP